jgi:hypothetical protein
MMVPAVTEVCLTAASAFPGPRLGLQFPGFAVAAVWAYEALGPARREQVSHAGRLILEALLELDQGTVKIGHLCCQRSVCSLYVLSQMEPVRHNIL